MVHETRARKSEYYACTFIVRMCFYIFELYYIILIEKRRVERLGFSITKNPKYQRFTVLVKGSTIAIRFSG